MGRLTAVPPLACDGLPRGYPPMGHLLVLLLFTFHIVCLKYSTTTQDSGRKCKGCLVFILSIRMDIIFPSTSGCTIPGTWYYCLRQHGTGAYKTQTSAVNISYCPQRQLLSNFRISIQRKSSMKANDRPCAGSAYVRMHSSSSYIAFHWRRSIDRFFLYYI